ncbi:protein of unknown function [Denitratisoma oestradiolicum]|uniref:Uncharacterized protein n=1 Tax=Denitratisoma oestradiolicum TaxID=311182 RepID=A0A6S6XZD2_9PROT|nr:protein of unknown function [Denitratisoma oestradiolicum]
MLQVRTLKASDAKASPFFSGVQRRSDALFFRIAVPYDLRPIIGGHAIAKTFGQRIGPQQHLRFESPRHQKYRWGMVN